MSRLIKVASVQHACTDQVSENLDTTEKLIENAADEGADLVLLSELHTRLYIGQDNHPSYFDWAEPIPGPTSDLLQQWSDTYNLVIVGSVFEHRGNGVYHNSCVVADDDGSIAGIYRKMHIPDDPGFAEKYYFTPGDADGFEPISTSVGRLGVLICWDQWFPEAARLMALAGADILLYPTAIGWSVSDDDAERGRQLEAWMTVQRGHAIANHLPLVVANRCGYEENPLDSEDGIEFWSDWDCEQMTEFAQTESFNRISEEQHRLYNIDMAPCIEGP
ncbi:MAG: nitrilase-related carbon-nitrogen hydrolase [Gammaproteobacteria bacterium]